MNNLAMLRNSVAVQLEGLLISNLKSPGTFFLSIVTNIEQIGEFLKKKIKLINQ